MEETRNMIAVVMTGLVAIKSLSYNPELLSTLKMEAFENIVGKDEKVDNQHFLFLPQYILPYQRY